MPNPDAMSASGTRADTAGMPTRPLPEPGSPAQQRAVMGGLPEVNVVYEVWDNQGLMREVARMKADIQVLAVYAREQATKHNALLQDTSDAMASWRRA